MRKFTIKAVSYLILAIIGLIFAVYSIKIENYSLLIVAILFAGVSTDNIFCNLREEKPSKRK